MGHELTLATSAVVFKRMSAIKIKKTEIVEDYLRAGGPIYSFSRGY
jgi:hypothetical protein